MVNEKLPSEKKSMIKSRLYSL